MPWRSCPDRPTEYTFGLLIETRLHRRARLKRSSPLLPSSVPALCGGPNQLLGATFPFVLALAGSDISVFLPGRDITKTSSDATQVFQSRPPCPVLGAFHGLRPCPDLHVSRAAGLMALNSGEAQRCRSLEAHRRRGDPRTMFHVQILRVSTFAHQTQKSPAKEIIKNSMLPFSDLYSIFLYSSLLVFRRRTDADSAEGDAWHMRIRRWTAAALAAGAVTLAGAGAFAAAPPATGTGQGIGGAGGAAACSSVQGKSVV